MQDCKPAPPDDTQPLRVLSASRRTDLVSCYPDYFIEKLAEYPPEAVHSVVIWTKNPANMLRPGPLREALGRYRQLYVHLTITGLGGTMLEPGIPTWREAVEMVPGVVAFVGDARRVCWRFDPLLRVIAGGEELANLPLFPRLAEQVSRSGITTCRTSWVEPYRKVQRRLDKKGITLQVYEPAERIETAGWLQKKAAPLGLKIQYCSMEGFARSRCIDGRLLAELHPDGLACSQRRAKSQRKLCGCTESIDIGWYSQKCPNGCLYCYAEPVVKQGFLPFGS
ncbi:DUF1848 family protein [Thermodesulfobacteriota bacterium]